MRTIDLNCDLGEGAGDDAALLEFVSSANVACGGHAGDRATMEATVAAAVARGVAVGAHPGYPDRASFGRTAFAMTPEEIEASVAAQLRALAEVAARHGVTLAHVKPHGALYHAAHRTAAIAAAIARAADPGFVLVGLAGSPVLDTWRAMGFRVAAEAFADRVYEPDGTLRARSLPGALIEEPERAAAQAVALALRGSIDTLCLHGDTPSAVSLARAVRAALEAAGIAVRSLRREET